MHLQVAPRHEIDDGGTARDLEQPAADIIVLSGADTELTALQRAIAGRGPDAPTVALTNFLQLGHPMSVDLYVERTLARARFILLRLLGGESYWPHGIEALRREALRRRIPFACLPGDTRWDPDFARRGTLADVEAERLWRYFAEGGPDNLAAALRWIEHALGGGPAPEPARPVPSAGFWPSALPSDGRPRAAILFYRALLQGGMTEPIEALAAALAARGVAAQPIFVTSLKDPVSDAVLGSAFAAAPPDVVINATAFAVGTPDAAAKGALGRAGCPVLQVALAGSSEAEWRASSRGLSPRDLAMQVVLPEVDGRIFAGAIAFKERPPGAPSFAPPVSRPLADRVEAAADLASAWIRLRRAAAPERRVALIVAN
ncbi:MAG: hydrogenobyrinic acid a,c-diamide cobaltochelatase, partial [Enterovirga sp.]|nr:hydrogenobyrinic acid a,c-diamide cobaltochelatase [Enterovirga sp.]